MAQDLAALTNTWMLNPYMFDPSQQSNQFSNYNNQALPWPPTYNTGAGGPVNAATGQPIQSFQQWQQQNPGGLSLNSTPAQPAPQAAPGGHYVQTGGGQYSGGGQNYGQLAGTNAPTQNVWVPNQAPAPQQAAAPQASGPPNNWQAALNALANPGKVTTPGATVPQATGSQPSGGVNQAFLNQAGAGQGMNQNFLSALRAIQARPQS